MIFQFAMLNYQTVSRLFFNSNISNMKIWKKNNGLVNLYVASFPLPCSRVPGLGYRSWDSTEKQTSVTEVPWSLTSIWNQPAVTRKTCHQFCTLEGFLPGDRPQGSSLSERLRPSQHQTWMQGMSRFLPQIFEYIYIIINNYMYCVYICVCTYVYIHTCIYILCVYIV